MFGVATQNGVGVGIGNIPSLTTLPYATQLYLAVLTLFSSGAPGAFLDANDWANVCFQDAAGTTPVTAMEQPVGLVLDKSQGLVQGADLITPVANRTFTSDTGFWSKDAGVTISGNAANWTSAVNTAAIYKSSLLASGKTYLITVVVTSVTGGGLKIYCPLAAGTLPTYSTPGTYTAIVTTTGLTSFGVKAVGTTTASISYLSAIPLAGNHAYQSTSANRPVITARYNLLLATAVLSTQSVTVGDGSHTLYFTGSGSVALSGAATGTKTAGSNVITCTAGTLTLTVTGSVLTADLRPSDQATGLIPTYQRVNTATDYDWSPAFPPMIKGNGSNQFLQTAAIDFTGTNKMTVWAGVRKTSDASAGMAAELSVNASSNNGAFALTAPDGGTPTYCFYSTGTSSKSASTTGYAAPITNIVTGISDISSPLVKIRVNGVDKTSTTTTQGTGNYSNNPLYILSRAGSSLFSSAGFNSLIILGAAATAAQISATETWCNSKIKAYA